MIIGSSRVMLLRLRQRECIFVLLLALLLALLLPDASSQSPNPAANGIADKPPMGVETALHFLLHTD